MIARNGSADVLEHPVVTRAALQSEFAGLAGSLRHADLVTFHTRHKLVLMAYSVAGQVQLGRIVAGPHPSAEQARREYGVALARVLEATPFRGRWLNAVLHAFGYVSARLSPEERQAFTARCASFHDGHEDLESLLSTLREYVGPGDAAGAYLSRQSLLDAPRPAHSGRPGYRH